MAILGALNIPLSVTTTGMSKGFQSGRKILNSFSKSFSSVQGMLAGAGLALSAAGLTAFVSKQSEAIDTAAKLSDRLGMSTESLTAFQHAGNLAGISAEEMEGWFNKLQKSIGEASDKSSPAAIAFRSLGLNADYLANIPLDQTLEQIADAISKLPNPVDKAQAALNIFGRSGQKLLPMLNGGAAGLAQARIEAEKLGISFSRVDAAKVEAANDAMTRAGAAVTGVGNQIAISLSPYIEAAATKFTELASSGGGLRESMGSGIQFVAEGFAQMADLIDIGAAAFYGLQGAALTVFSAIARGAQGLPQLLIDILPKSVSAKLGLETANTFADEFSKGLEGEAAASFEKANKALTAPSRADGVSKMFADIGAGADASALKIAEAAKQNGQFTAGFKKAEDAQKAQEAAQSRIKSIFEATRTPLEKYNETVAELNDLRTKGLDTTTFDRALAQADEQLNSTEKNTAGPAGGIAAAQQGSAAAFSSIQASIREGGGANAPQKQTAANTFVMAANSRIQTDLLRFMASNTPEVVGSF
jgi:plasmid maintenance system antidote protein VapI